MATERPRTGKYERSRGNARGVEVPPDLLKQIRALVDVSGEAHAKATLSINRNTLSRVLAGLTVRKKTLALLQERLGSNSTTPQRRPGDKQG